MRVAPFYGQPSNIETILKPFCRVDFGVIPERSRSSFIFFFLSFFFVEHNQTNRRPKEIETVKCFSHPFTPRGRREEALSAMRRERWLLKREPRDWGFISFHFITIVLAPPVGQGMRSLLGLCMFGSGTPGVGIKESLFKFASAMKGGEGGEVRGGTHKHSGYCR